MTTIEDVIGLYCRSAYFR